MLTSQCDDISLLIGLIRDICELIVAYILNALFHLTLGLSVKFPSPRTKMFMGGQ